jgi:hypothetical protein
MSHDQLFKDLLQAFFQEFMELFFPMVAARLDFSEVIFFTTEAFTDIPVGERRFLDLVARVTTQDGEPELILVHVEIQSERRHNFPFRMCEYYWLLRLRYGVSVFPVALYLVPGAGGLVQETYMESLFDRDVNRFCYDAIGLPDLSAEDYRGTDNPLAPALSALMRPGAMGRLAHKLQSLRRVLGSSVDAARKSLLINVIQTYMPLNPAEDTEFRALIERENAKEVQTMLVTWAEQMMIDGKRDLALHMLRRKFGELPEPVVTRLQAIQTGEELERISDRLFDATSLEEMGLLDTPEAQ